ncbi:DUF2637 domain-containing protein [Rhodococcus hoagii]|nr:DUF2637 domain-containing protein [Prescottella equi]
MKTVASQLRGWHVAVALAITGTLAVAALAFSMSFTKLSRLAVLHDVDAGQAWMFPLIVDGLIVVATVCTAIMRRNRWYAWTLLLAGSAASVAGNGIYAWETSGTALAVSIAVVPPLVLLGVTHLTMLLAAERPEPHPAAAAPAAVERVEPEPVAVHADDAASEPDRTPEHIPSPAPRRAASRELVHATH